MTESAELDCLLKAIMEISLKKVGRLINRCICIDLEIPWLHPPETYAFSKSARFNNLVHNCWQPLLEGNPIHFLDWSFDGLQGSSGPGIFQSLTNNGLHFQRRPRCPELVGWPLWKRPRWTWLEPSMRHNPPEAKRSCIGLDYKKLPKSLWHPFKLRVHWGWFGEIWKCKTLLRCW